jgi:hypothetical protein
LPLTQAKVVFCGTTGKCELITLTCGRIKGRVTLNFCSSCGAELSQGAAFCSKCGTQLVPVSQIAGADYPDPDPSIAQPSDQSNRSPSIAQQQVIGRRKKPGCWAWLVLSGLICFFVLRAVAYYLDSLPSSTFAAFQSTAAPQPDETSSPSEPIVTHKDGFTIIGGLAYHVYSESIKYLLGNEYDAKRASGEYIVLYVSVANAGNRPAQVSGADFHLVRGTASYDQANDVNLSDEFFISTINPGVQKNGSLVFDVPASTPISSYSLEVYGNGDGTSTTIPL